VLRRALLAFGLVLVALVALAGPAAAHAQLVGSDPAAGAVVAEPPALVTLRFSEEVEPTLGGIEVFDTDQRVVDVGPTERVPGDVRSVQATLPELADGTYAVLWRVTSADGHPVQGAFAFSVGNEAPGDTTGLVGSLLERQDDSGITGALLGLSRFAVFAGLALLIGAAFCCAVLWTEGASWWPARRLVWFGLAFALLGTVGGFVLQGPYAAGRPLGDAFGLDLWSDVAETRFGKASLLRLAVLVAAVPLVADLRQSARTAWRVSGAVIAVVLAASVALAGHATTGDLAALAVVSHTVHVLAMAGWVGALAVLVLVALARVALAPAPAVPLAVGAAVAEEVALAPATDDSVGPALERFSKTALVAVGVVAVTGLFQGWRLLGEPADLWSTSYGRTLLWKVGAVAVAVALGGLGRWGLRRRVDPRGLRPTLGIELGTQVVVLVLSAALVGLSPNAGEGGEPFAASLVQGQVIADVSMAPATVGANELHVVLTVPGGSLNPVDDAAARFELASAGTGPLPVTLVPAGPNHYVSSGLVLPFAGDWELEVVVTPEPGRQVRLTTVVPVT